MSRTIDTRNAPRLGRPEGPGSAPTRKVFNRSSFEGDFLVTIPGQTAGDFEEYAPEMQFCEYVAGTIYMPSPVSDEHQELVLFLAFLFGDFADRQPGRWQVLAGPAVLRLTPERFLEPDLFLRLRESGPGSPPALFVLEILSPSNRAYDLEWKSAFYQEAGIPEVWYVDPRDQAVVVDRKADRGYSRERLDTGSCPRRRSTASGSTSPGCGGRLFRGAANAATASLPAHRPEGVESSRSGGKCTWSIFPS
jgi:Uma2 family endonuclease